jgi:ubiquinone/menaquinone biosynthesis C-methylase UbiE
MPHPTGDISPTPIATLPGVRRKSNTALLGELLSLWKPLLRVTAALFALSGVVAFVRFPGKTDVVGERHIGRPTDYSQFYKSIYKAPDASAPVAEKEDESYVKIAKKAIEDAGVVPRVQDFVKQYRLEKARVLDVGSGTGYLQDIVENYVGLDISPTASRYYHKPFVEASATEMPLPDNEFDAVWSVWVLEHVPNPEQALGEIRRVAKDGGLLFLFPAWRCTEFAADGYPVRPFSDFDMKGKIYKAAFHAQFVPPVLQFEQIIIRTALAANSLGGGPTRLHYRPITPNYDHYWMNDSDAINWLDRYEMSLWFTSRGDECLNCGDRFMNVWDELVIRVHKN